MAWGGAVLDFHTSWGRSEASGRRVIYAHRSRNWNAEMIGVEESMVLLFWLVGWVGEVGTG